MLHLKQLQCIIIQRPCESLLKYTGVRELNFIELGFQTKNHILVFSKSQSGIFVSV